MPMSFVRGQGVKDMECSLGVAHTGARTPRCLFALCVQDAWRLKPQSSCHRFRPHPNLTATWHPIRSDLELGSHQDAVVASPASALLWDTIFQHDHAGPEQPAHHRLNHAGPEVKALQAGGVVKSPHEVRRGQRLALWLQISGDRHRRLRQIEAQRLQPHIHMRSAMQHDGGGAVTFCHQRQRVHPMRTCHTECAPSVGGGCQTTWPRHHQDLRKGALRGALKHMAVRSCGGFWLGPTARWNHPQHTPQQNTPGLPKKEKTHGTHG